ncbi:MAG: N-acetylmuramic acid 6-phosphate etherase [Devosia sp.]
MTAPEPPTTELADQRFAGLDTWQDAAILTALLDGQRRAVDSVAPAIPQIAAAAQLATRAIEQGGRLIYLAAGSPALMSLADALEIPQTYGVARDRIALIFAGGHAITQNLTGPFEDDAEGARRDVAGEQVGAPDCVVAVSASGSTPYTVAGLQAAKAAGAATIAIAGNAGAPLFGVADVPILLAAGAEVISGSTRLGAGTAQKAALNLMSTLIGVRLGHVHDGYMVNVVADNAKLRARAERIVSGVTGVAQERAANVLKQSAGHVKPAILLAAGAGTLDAAEALLIESRGRVRAALARLRG